MKTGFIAAGIFLSGFGAICVQGQVYEVTEIGTMRTDLGGTSVAYAISSSDVIVGAASSDAAASSPFRRRPGFAMENLGFINSAAYGGYAGAINASGTITGLAVTQSGGFASAYRFLEGTPLLDLPELSGGGDSVGYAINSEGTIVGWSNRQIGCGGADCTSNPGSAVRWVGNEIQTIGGLGGFFSVATGINNAGDICGWGAVASGMRRGFRLTAGASAPTELTGLGDGASGDNTAAINNGGQIVGSAATTSAGVHAALWNANAAEDLGALTALTNSAAGAVSDNGLIVGSAYDATDSRAVVFRRGSTPVDLNTMIDPSAGWILNAAYGVNNSGKIVGVGMKNGLRRGFLLTPTLRLEIQRTGQTQARITWPAAVSGFVLESSATLPASLWETVTSNPPVVSDKFSVDVTTLQAGRYYRLRML